MKKPLFLLFLVAAVLLLAGARWAVDGLRWSARRLVPAPVPAA